VVFPDQARKNAEHKHRHTCDELSMIIENHSTVLNSQLVLIVGHEQESSINTLLAKSYNHLMPRALAIEPASIYGPPQSTHEMTAYPDPVMAVDSTTMAALV
jgi:hypothetical protein